MGIRLKSCGKPAPMAHRMAADFRALALLAVAVLVLATPATAAQELSGIKSLPGGASDYEIFLTEAAYPEATDWKGQTGPHRYYFPTEQKISFAWSNQGHAVHIPFYVPQANRLQYDIKLSIDGYIVTAEGKKTPKKIRGVAGLYRFDGRPIGFDKNKRGSRCLHFSMSRGTSSCQTFTWKHLAVGAMWRVANQQAEGADATSEFSIVVTNVPAPGRMAAWWIPQSYSELANVLIDKERIDVSLTVEFVKATATGIGDEPVEIAVPEPQTFEYTIYHNGWQFSQPKVEIEGQDDEKGWSKPKLVTNFDRSEVRKRIVAEDLGTQFGGGRFQTANRFTDHVAKPPTPTVHEIHLEVPERWLDHQNLDLTGKTVSTKGNVYPKASNYGGGFTFRGKVPWPKWAKDAGESRPWHKLPVGTKVERAFTWSPSPRRFIPNKFREKRESGPTEMFAIETHDGGFDKTVRFFATRLSELKTNKGTHERTEAAQTYEVTPDDGFHEWSAAFPALAAETFAEVSEARVKLATLYSDTKPLRRDHLTILRGFLREGQTDSEGGWSLSAIVAAKKEMERLRAQIREKRKEQEPILQGALAKTDALIANAQAQAKKSPKRKPPIADTIEFLKNERDIIELNLFDAAGWYEPGEMGAVVKRLESRPGHVGLAARLTRVKWLLARGELLQDRAMTQHASPNGIRPDSPLLLTIRDNQRQSYYELKELLHNYPDSAEVREMIRGQQRAYVRRVAAKLERDKAASIEGFNHYLSSRGYDVRQPGTWPQAAWEFARIWWSSGPITLMGGLPGFDTPEAIADAAIIEQGEIARDHMSLLAIRRLLKNGMTLAEIRNISTELLATRLVAHRTDLKPLDPHKAWPIAQDIHTTFAGVPELRALAEGNIDEFERLIDIPLYANFDTGQSWGEWLGDIFSPRHLIFLFAPSAVVGTGGEWSVVGLQSAEKMQGMRSLRDVFSGAVRASRLGQWMAGTGAATRLKAAIEADRKFMQALLKQSELKHDALEVARLGAVVLFWGGGSYLAAESDIPGLRLLVEILAELHGQEIFSDLLTKGGRRAARLAGKVDDFSRAVKRQSNETAELGKLVDELDELAKKAKPTTEGGHPMLDAAQKKQLGTLRRTVPTKEAPGLHLSEAESLRASVQRASKALEDGDVVEAQRAIRASRSLHKRQTQQLKKLEEKVDEARSTVKAAAGKTRKLSKTQVSKDPPVGDWPGAPRFFNKQYYDTGLQGAALRKGDSAFRRGEMDEALDAYRQARHHAERAQWGNPAEKKKFLEFLDEHMTLAEGVKAARRARAARLPNATRVNADQAISPETGRILADELAGGTASVTRLSGSRNPVFEVVDSQGNRYIFKHIDDDTAATESAAAALYNALGGKAPAARGFHVPGRKVKVKKKNPALKKNWSTGEEEILDAATGQMRRARDDELFIEVEEEMRGVLMRHVGKEAKELAGKTEAEILALQKELAEQRAFRIWLGDTDGHMANQLLGADERLWAIDFDMANLSNNTSLKQLGGSSYRNPDEFLDNAADLPRQFSVFNRSQGDPSPHYEFMVRLDDMLQYNDMAPMLSKIQDLCADNGAKLRPLLQQHLPDDKIDDAVRVLTERANALDGVVRSRFPDRLRPGTDLKPPPGAVADRGPLVRLAA